MKEGSVSKVLLYTLGVCLSVCVLLQPQVSTAQAIDKLCLWKGKFYIAKECRIATHVGPEVLKPLLGTGSDAPCSSCGQDMSGDWTYTLISQSNSVVYQRNITFTQSNGIFSGSNASHTIVGKVEGRWLRLTQTVSGEEGEGFVRLAEGSLFETDGGFLLGTLAVTGETTGGGGALILRKAP